MPEIQNRTFRGDCNKSHFNACVGENGWNDMFQYALGYMRGSQCLLEKLEDEMLLGDVDILVYPIIYNARHGAELVLKAVMELVQNVRPAVEINYEQIFRTHDLSKLWQVLVDKLPEVDKRFNAFLSSLDEHINDYVVVDSTGQVFRYSEDSVSRNQHLKDVSVINLLVFKARFIEFQKLLEDFYYLASSIVDEYALGTYTTKLSRVELDEIAGMLPNKKDWVDEAFDDCRSRIMSKYGLSSNDFSRAVKVIERHPTFASKIGIEIPLKYASEKDIFTVVNAVRRDASSSVGAMLKLDENAILEVCTLYEIGKGNTLPCEEYNPIFEEQKNDVKFFGLSHYASHYCGKNHFKESVIKGLRIMGNVSIANSLSLTGL